MRDEQQAEAHVPITISIDVEQLLKSELGWTAYTDDIGEPDYAPGGDGRIVDVVAAKLAAAIQNDVKTAVLDAVRERTLDQVDDLIDEVMEGSIRLTSQYGEPKSPETTLREAMIKAMTDRLESKVDRDGKPSRNDSYGRSDKTYLQWRAEQTASTILDKELSSKLAEAAKAIKVSATEIVGKKIAEVLGRGF